MGRNHRHTAVGISLSNLCCLGLLASPEYVAGEVPKKLLRDAHPGIHFHSDSEADSAIAGGTIRRRLPQPRSKRGPRNSADSRK
jgi:hypothetical protein